MNWHQVWTLQNLKRLMVGNFPDGAVGGLLLSLAIGVITIVLSTLLGTVIGLMRNSSRPIARIPATLYVETARNVPIVIIVFWAYFVPPYFGLEPSKFVSVVIALVIFTAAYVAEIVRGGIRSVPHAHIEAARALGLTKLQTQAWVILPQAFFNMIPAMTGRYITVIKNTSLAFLIGLSDLTQIGKEINTRLLSAPVEVYATLLIIYFVVNMGLSAAMRSLEDVRRFNRLFARI